MAHGRPNFCKDGGGYSDEFLEQVKLFLNCREFSCSKISSADSTEVLAVEDEAWEGFLEVLGLGCLRAAAFLAHCSQKFTLGGGGVSISGGWVFVCFLYNLVSWVLGGGVSGPPFLVGLALFMFVFL
ncbi:hypothetical protein TNCV_4067391 [Trichonephila clavipes]|nr:hypothetical protein TNCV_4067391 [Trichonephila clavipes]